MYKLKSFKRDKQRESEIKREILKERQTEVERGIQSEIKREKLKVQISHAKC